MPRTGTTGGTYSSTPGLTIDALTGTITPGTSTAGQYTVTYTITAPGCSAYSTSAVVTIIANPAAPIVTTPVNYCQNVTASQLTATGSNLMWGNGTVSGSVGGTTALTAVTYIEKIYNNQKTNFTTTAPNVTITSVDYYIPSWQAVSGFVLGLYDNLGNLLAYSSTNTSLGSLATGTKVTNIFNYTIANAGSYSVGIYAGSGNIGYDNPSFPITEPTGTVNITGVSSPGFRCYTNIQFTVNNSPIAPIPSTLTQGTTSYAVTQTVNGCMSPQANISVVVNTPTDISQIPVSGIQSYYQFEGDANDVFLANNGILQNNPTITTDRFGIANAAYSMNGSSNYVSTTNAYSNPTNFSISIWFKTASVTGGKLIGFGDARSGQSNTFDRHIYMNNAGQVYFGVYPGSVVTVNSASSYNDNKWHLATATLSSSSGMALYIDGYQVGSNASATTAQNYSGYWKIGFDNVNGWTSQPSSFYFNGSLDDALIYGRALNAAEVAVIYNSPDGAGNNGPVCAGSTLSLNAKTLAGASYSWVGPNGFSSSAQNPTISYSAANAGTYTVTVTSITGCTATAYTNVVSNSTGGQWLGNISNDWANANNWCSGIVPDATTDVTIAATAVRMPVISTSAACKNLTINSGATVITSAAGTLNIAGLLTNNGTMTNNGTTVFNGTSGQQTFSGVTTFNHITINNANGLLLPANIVVNNVTLSKGILNTNNYNIDVKGSWINNASVNALQAGSNTVSFTGTTLQTIGGSFETLFNNLTASNTGSTITLTNNIKIASSLVIGGVLDLGTFTANRTTVGGTLYLQSTGHLKIGGTNTLPSNYATNTFLVASKVEYAGTNQTISAQNYGHLILSSSAGAAVKTAPASFSTQAKLVMNKGAGTSVSFTPSSNINIGDNVELGTGTIFNGAGYTHTISGNWINEGIFNGNTSTVVLNGASKNVSGAGVQNFNNLTIAASNITFSNQGLTLSGNLVTTGSGSFVQASGGTVTMTGNLAIISGTGISIDNLTINGSGKVTANNSLTFTGSLNAATTSNTFAGGPGTTMTLSGTNKTLSGSGSFAFKNLNITGSGISTANFSVDGSLIVAGSFSATAGTASFIANSSLSGTANLYNSTINGTKLQLASNSILGIANTFSITAGNLDVTSSVPNTVNYNGPNAQNIYPTTYNNLTISSGNIKTATSALIINKDITIGNATTFSAGAYVHTIFGDWINNGTFVSGAGNIKFAGAATSNIYGATSFNFLTIDHTSNSTTLVLQSDVTAVLVNMVKGMMLTGIQTLTITSDRTGNGIILGNIKRKHTFNAGTNYAFEGPDNTIIFSAVSGVDSVMVSVVKGSINDFPLGASINRVYNISIPTGTYTTAKLRLHYEDNELNGNDESSMNLWNYTGSAWVSAGSKTGNDVTANYVEQSGIPNITNRWTLSGAVSEFVWTGTIDTDWNKPGNWKSGGATATRVPVSTDVVNIGSAIFNSQPTISSAVSVKNIILGSAKSVQLSMAPGGSLNSGTISGNWSTNTTHVINVNDQSVDIQGDLALSDGTSGHAINLNINNGAVTIAETLTQSGGANITFSGSGKLQIAGEFNYNSGAFTPATGTVEYNGINNQSVGNVLYNHLTINKATGLASIDNPTTVNGDLTITNGKLINNNISTIRGNVTISTGAILENSNIIHVGGNWQNNGTFNGYGINTIFDGTGTQTISKTTFNNLEFNKPVGSLVILTGDVTMNGNLVGTSGTLDIQSYFFNRLVVGGSASMSDNATLIIAADNAPTKFANYFLSSGSTVIFNGTSVQHLQLPGVVYGNIIFRNSGTKLLLTPITVNTKLSIENSAIFDAGGNTITLNGDWQNNGTFNAGSSTVTWNGLNNTISGATTFNKVTVSGKYNVISNIIFNDLLTLTPSGAITSGVAQTHTLNGDLINSGDLLLLGETIFTGTRLQTLSLLNAVRTVAAIITFNGTVSPALNSTSAPQFNVLNINNIGGVTPSVGWTILAQLNIAAGASFNCGPYTQNLLGNLNNNGIITTGGTFNFTPAAAATLKFGTGFSSTGTVVFGGAGPITMTGSPASLKNVTISNSNIAGVMPSSNWVISNNFLINAGSIFNAGAGIYRVGGNVTNLGTINKGSSLFTLDGTLLQSVSSLSPFNNLAINKASGEVNLLSNISIAGSLSFISGKIVTGSYAVMQPAGASVSGASQNTGWVSGNLQKNIQTGATIKTFEIGDNTYYTPASISFNNVSTAGDLLVYTTSTEHPNLNTSTINPSRSVNRYWSFINKGVAFNNYTGTFNFISQDIDAGSITSDFKTALYNGSSWTYPLTASPNTTNIQATGVTSFGDFAIGQICNAGTSISYSGTPYCNSGTANVTFTGTGGGKFTSSPGLSIDANTGTINLSASAPGVYIINYTINATSECSGYLTSSSITISAAPAISAITTSTCVGGNTGTINVTGVGGTSPYLYSFNSAAYQSSALFSNLSEGSYSISIKDNLGCTSASSIAVSRFANSTDDQNAAGTDTWIGHMYDGIAFNNYIGSFAEPEIIDESFGGDAVCFDVNSGNGTSSVKTETFSVKFRMNSTKSGLYIVTAGSDDGGRLTVDGKIVHSVWDDHSFNTNSVILNLNGSSSLLYEYYENGGGNRVMFNNLTLVLANILSTNNSQSICIGSPGLTISGDSFAGNLPSGSPMPLYGTGYEWYYSTSLTGERILIAGATGPTFTPSAAVAPFNVAGTYYVYRNARLQTSYIAIHESSPAIITVLSTNSISYGNSSYCENSGTALPVLSGIANGTYSSTTGLVIDSQTGSIDLNMSIPGTYAVAYTVNGSCPATTSITITPIPAASISYSGSPYCTGGGSASVTLTGTAGGIYSSATGLSINSTTGAINPGASTAGTYQVSYTIAGSGGCSVVTATATVTITDPGSWTGAVSSDWSESGNWLCGSIPGSTTNVIISGGMDHYPVIVTGTGTINNLAVQSGGTLTISGGSLQVNGSINNSGKIDAVNGTIETTGTAAQSISGSMFYNKTIKNLIVSNSDMLSVSAAANDTLKISGVLSFGNSSSKINTGDNITLLSNDTATASVGIVGTGNSITGKVVVERYINTGSGPGQHGKSWQLLATPTNGQSVKESWMEGDSPMGNSHPGYGTQVTSPGGIAAGFDMSSVSPSMKYYSNATDSWVGITNTGNPVYDQRGYMVFIRGDRSVNGTTVKNPTPATLRTKGTLLTGTLGPISVVKDKYESIGNPYASAIDFTAITKDAGIDNKFYTWDPYLYGSYGLGGYQTISSVNNWEPVPGGTKAYKTGESSSIIQSGQAFLVHATGIVAFVPQTYTMTFSESAKAVGAASKSNARPFGEGTSAKGQFFSVSLFTGTGAEAQIADGNTVAFNKSYSNNIDGDDALKIQNSGENFGLKRAGKILAIEAKSPVENTDTLYYNMSNLKQQTYQLRFAPKNMESGGLEAYLADKFLKTATPVSLSESSFVNITITSGAGSSAADRFSVIFRPMAVLPVTFTSVKAYEKNGDIEVSWKVENESDMQQYEVEQSADGNKFTKAATEQAGNSGAGSYSWIDKEATAGYNYYRIRSISKNGKSSYTQIVKVLMGRSIEAISVYPNPVINETINLELTNQPAGVYGIRLLNNLGQVILSKAIIHAGGSASEQLKPEHQLAKGIYQLEITKPNGEVKVIKVVN